MPVTMLNSFWMAPHESPKCPRRLGVVSDNVQSILTASLNTVLWGTQTFKQTVFNVPAGKGSNCGRKWFSIKLDRILFSLLSWLSWALQRAGFNSENLSVSLGKRAAANSWCPRHRGDTALLPREIGSIFLDARLVTCDKNRKTAHPLWPGNSPLGTNLKKE